MLLGHHTISAYTRQNMSIWMILAFQAGILNMGGFLACHSFVSHVTGFATLFGQGIGEQDYTHAAALLVVPGCFVLGAMLSAILVDLRLKLGKRPKYYLVFGLLFILILGVVIGGFNGLFGKFGEPLKLTRNYLLLSLMCMICGVQNATVSLVSKSVVRTTHLTGLTTDLGIGLVRVANAYRLPDIADQEIRANLMRAGIIGFFVLGSVTGFFVFTEWQFRGFIFPTTISGLLFFASLYFQLIRPHLQKWNQRSAPATALPPGQTNEPRRN